MIRDVPVFKEHSYVRRLFNRDGTPQIDSTTGRQAEQVETYDFKALKAMVDNCNRRVRETESFAPLIDIHTGKRKPDGTLERPNVYGFGGPYRLGMYGNEERQDGAPYKGKWAIYEDEFWFADKASLAREMARRSPEVYVGRPMHDRFLDPITVLGAETPALDMGIHYSKGDKGELVERYSSPDIVAYDGAACMPGATNVVVPKPVDVKDKKARYDGDDEMQYAMGDESNMADEYKTMLNDPARKQAQMDFHKSQFIKHKDAHTEFTRQAEEHKAAGKESEAQTAGQLAFGHKRAANKHREDYMDLKNHVTNHGEAPLAIPSSKYSQVDSDTVNACVAAMMETQIIQRMAQFLDAADAPVNPKTMLQSEEMEQAEQQGLEADGTPAGVEEDQPNEADESDVEEPNPTDPNAKGNEMPTPATPAVVSAAPVAPIVPKDEKEKYALQEFMRDTTVKYDQLVQKYDQQQAELTTLKDANNQLVTERNSVVRQSKIKELGHTYMFDVNKAITRYSQATEEVFQTWADTIVETCEKNPIGAPSLFIPAMDLPPGSKPQDVGQYGGAQMEDVQGIVQYQQERMMAGEDLSYTQAKQQYMKERTA